MSGALGYPGVYSSGVGGAASMAYPPSYIENLLASRASASTVGIAIGSCRDDTNTDNIDVIAPLTADITTTGANGRNVDTAEQANKWYGVYVIKNPTTGAVASFLINEDDVGAFTFPAGYTLKRRVGWMRNNSFSDLRVGKYFGLGSYRKFLYDIPKSFLLALTGGSAVAFTDVDISEWVPPTSQLSIVNVLYDPYGTSSADLRAKGSTTTTPVTFVYESTEPSNTVFDIDTDANQVIQYQVNNASDNLDIYVAAFYDFL